MTATSPRNKGTNYCFITKTLMARRGAELERQFLSQLTAEELDLHRTALPTTWLDAALASRILAKAGALLYPNDPHPLYECGRIEGGEHLSTGVYRILKPILSVGTIVSQTAKIWSRYHDRGAASFVPGEVGAATVQVSDYPELSPELRDVVAGYIAGAIQITGAKNVKVAIDARDPYDWQFKITYVV